MCMLSCPVAHVHVPLSCPVARVHVPLSCPVGHVHVPLSCPVAHVHVHIGICPKPAGLEASGLNFRAIKDSLSLSSFRYSSSNRIK